MNTHECPICHQLYSGQDCVNCLVRPLGIDEEKHMTAYIKNLKHNIIRVFSKRKDINEIKNFNDIKEEMYKDMMNPSPSQLFPDSKFDGKKMEFLLEQEKRLEQEKPSLKVFEIRVWEYGPPPIGMVMPRRELKDVIIMLSENFDTVGEQMNKEFAYYKNSDMDVVIKEVEGPFKSGSVLSSWDTKWGLEHLKTVHTKL